MGLSVLEARLAGDAIRHLLALTPRLVGPNLVGPDPIHVSLAQLPLPRFFTFTRGGALPYFRIGDDANGERWELTTDANQPRIASPDGKLSRRGLLIEPTRENTCLRSAELENAVWVGIGATPTRAADTRVAPDGNTAADDAGDDNAASREGWQQSVTVVAASTNIYSAWGRELTGTVSALGARDGAADSELEIDSATWVRRAMSVTMAAGTTFIVRVLPGGDAAAGIGTASYWGMQVEEGVLYATSHIPAAGAAVTRNGDVTTLNSADLSAWIRPESGRVRKIWVPEADSSAAADWRIFLLTALDYFRIRGTRVVQLVNAGAEVDSSPALTWTANSTVFVFDFVWGGGTATLRIFKDGALEDVLTGAWTPPTFGANFWLGASSAGISQAPGIFPAIVIG